MISNALYINIVVKQLISLFQFYKLKRHLHVITVKRWQTLIALIFLYFVYVARNSSFSFLCQSPNHHYFFFLPINLHHFDRLVFWKLSPLSAKHTQLYFNYYCPEFFASLKIYKHHPRARTYILYNI